MGGGIVALLSVALHPLMAIFPLVYFYRNKLSLIKYLVIAGAVLLISLIIFIINFHRIYLIVRVILMIVVPFIFLPFLNLSSLLFLQCTKEILYLNII